MNDNPKKMYKVLSPLEKKGGGTYWMRIGSAFTNRDNSLNVYLDAMPPSSLKSQRFELQIREMTEEDFRRREDRAATPAAAPADSAYPPAFNRDARAVTASGDGETIPF
jgi:hypothetical protein